MRSIALLMLLGTLPAAAQAPWKRLDFLLGKWTASVGEKDTSLGAGQGGFSFELQLNQKIMVRRNFAEYAAAPRHDDLMVIYLDPPNDMPRAIYFDSEGHTIRYNLSFPSPNAVIFESDGTQPGPRYRLSYGLERGALNGRFEVAAPGAEYKPYMSWTSKKN